MKTVEELFDDNTTKKEMELFFKEIKDTYNKDNGFSSIPRKFYPYLNKLRSFKKLSSISKFTDDEIRTYFVGNGEYNNLQIMFYDVNGVCYEFGIKNAIDQWQKEKDNIWDEKRKSVLKILRNISGVAVDKFKAQLKFPIKDAISGEELTCLKDVEIDHYDDDFVKVAFDWMFSIKEKNERYYKKNCDIVNILYKNIDNNKLYFKSKDTSIDFYKYHNSHTHLRPLTPHNNRSRSKEDIEWGYLKIPCKIKIENDKKK